MDNDIKLKEYEDNRTHEAGKVEDRPEYGKTYSLTGGQDTPSVMRGDGWKNSEVVPLHVTEKLKREKLNTLRITLYHDINALRSLLQFTTCDMDAVDSMLTLTASGYRRELWDIYEGK